MKAEAGMKSICLMRNRVQNYAWGSTTAIPDLLGEKNPGGTPQAELWMGAHAKAPSFVNYQGQWIPLPELIKAYPMDILGEKVTKRFGNRLPYLFKVLAAARPLSIQAHPNLKQAQKGFERENALKIPFSAPNRNYKDANHKPECLCAVTPFWALCGFRNCMHILALLKKINLRTLSREVDDFNSQPDSNGLKAFFTALMCLASPRLETVVTEAREKALAMEKTDPVFEWMVRLAGKYPNDIGLLAPILLNLVQLQPGQAIFIPAGDLHAYLNGAGIELMANSDNVLRGGLTPKHVDVPELLRILNFDSRAVDIQEPEINEHHERIYSGDASEFVLSAVTLSGDDDYCNSELDSVEILLCTAGSATIHAAAEDKPFGFEKGMSVLIPAAVQDYTIKGNCTFYKAAVPP